MCHGYYKIINLYLKDVCHAFKKMTTCIFINVQRALEMLLCKIVLTFLQTHLRYFNTFLKLLLLHTNF